jgi:type VI secretion system secreted protein VgrG
LIPVRTGYTQEHSYLSVTTPLGADVLLLMGLYGEESISGLFHFELEMVSGDANLDFSKIVGKSATVALALGESENRYINGIVTRFVQTGGNLDFATYRAELRPWLWWLTLRTDSRIFQAKSSPEIIKSVFSDLGFADFKDQLTGAYAARDYCVQYQESAFDFVSRLMEEEGIYYFFEHAAGKHTLVLADDSGAIVECPNLAKARFRPETGTQDDLDVVYRWALEEQAVPKKYAADDYNFETPSTELLASEEASSGRMEVYEYPGGHSAKSGGDARAKIRLQELQHPARSVRGDSFCRAFTPGCKFTLAGHFRDDLNDTYVLRRVAHSATHEEYSNTFEAYPLTLPYRPPRVTAKARVNGAQTATVVGKSGEEIWTDKYGRVKVQFHWDREGKKDENSSCWVRVAQGWAGSSWGSLFLPRIGQEVIVSFVEGDPDRPLVTGSVYNAEKTVPYTLPDEQTKSTVKSNSSKGGGGFNEIRFEDKKDAEEVFVHAQKDMTIKVENDRKKDVLHDEIATIKNDRTATIQEGNEKLVVAKGERTVLVETGKETHEVKGERSLTVTGNETHANKADYSQKVTGNYELKVTGNLVIDVTGTISIKSAQSLTSEAGMGLTNKAGTDLLNKAGVNLTNDAGVELTNKAGVNLINDAGVQLTNKASATQTVDGGGMLTVKGGLVKIN